MNEPEEWSAVTARIEAERTAAGMVTCPACNGPPLPST